MSKDLFSKHASQYAAFRPTYPQELFDFIYSHTNRFDNAWDAGTGNGQVARELSKKFQRVFATDISEGQIANATQALNINYSIAAETTNFADHTLLIFSISFSRYSRATSCVTESGSLNLCIQSIIE